MILAVKTKKDFMKTLKTAASEVSVGTFLQAAFSVNLATTGSNLGPKVKYIDNNQTEVEQKLQAASSAKVNRNASCGPVFCGSTPKFNPKAARPGIRSATLTKSDVLEDKLYDIPQFTI